MNCAALEWSNAIEAKGLLDGERERKTNGFFGTASGSDVNVLGALGPMGLSGRQTTLTNSE